MTRLNRFALLAGVLALGVAACGDDVQVVEPTPPQPPPPPPVTATMAPASASVAVGNSVVFAVNASGGVAGEAASWTCSSSNTGIATATSTSAGCSATGVAAGDVTITASVSKSGETVNVGAQLTVTDDTEPTQPPGDPAFVYIQNIADGAATVSGRVAVGISVDRGDQELEELSLLVDGTVVASQSFGGGMDMGMTPPDDEAAEQAVPTFTMAFDSDDYDRDTGVPVYMNGEHTVSAELEIGVTMADGMHGHETISSNVVTVEFKNSNFLAATVSGLGDGAMNAETGQMWYGGHDGMLEISALPVLYTGSVDAITLTRFCGDDAATDSEAPFSFEVDCGGFEGVDTPTFNVGGTEMVSKGGKVYLDFKGPPAPHFNVNPNGREDGWVNLTVDFLGKFHKDRNKNGWLVYNEDEGGVGGYAPQLRFSSTTPSIVDGAIAATANALPTAPTMKDAVCVVATAVDLLGNESKLPSAGTGCAMASAYATTEGTGDDATTTYAAGLRAGLDVSAPTIEFSAASPKANATSLKNFQVQVADAGTSSTGKSGLHSDPVLAKIEVRNAKNETICGDQKDVGGPVGEKKITGECALTGEGLDFNDPLATTAGLVGPKTHGYYTFTAVSRDKAGNRSEEAVRTALEDNATPKAGVIVGGYSKGAYTLTATITDDLSIKSYWAESMFADAVAFGIGTTSAPLILPKEGMVAVDAYDSAEFTQSMLETVTVHTFRAVQTGAPGGTLAQLASIGIKAVDQAGGNTMALGIADISTATLGDVDQFGQIATAGTFAADAAAVTYERDEVFQTFSADKTGVDGSTVELRAEIEGTADYEAAKAAVVDDPDTTEDETAAAVDGTEGLVNNPVSRVDFYAAVALKDVSTADDTDRVPPVPDGTPGTIAETEALVFLGSASAAGAVDSVDDQGNADPADDVKMRKYVWGIDLSGADVLAAVGKSKSEEHDVQIIAVAVNSDGVAIFDSVSEADADAQTTLVEITVEK